MALAFDAEMAKREKAAARLAKRAAKLAPAVPAYTPPTGVMTPAELMSMDPMTRARTLGRLGVQPDLSTPPWMLGKGYASGVSPLASTTADELAMLPQSARAGALQRLATPDLSAFPAAGPQMPAPAAPLAAAGAPAAVAPYATGAAPAAPAAGAVGGVTQAAVGAVDDVAGLGGQTAAKTAAAETAKQGMLAGIMGKAPLGRIAAGMGMGSAAEAGTMASRVGTGTLGRALPYALAGSLGGSLVDKVWNDPNSSSDNALKNGLQGAGYGAALGSMVLPGIGTAIGAVGGGVGGALLGKYGSKSTGDVAVANELGNQRSQLIDLFNKLGVSDAATRSQVLTQLEAGSYGAQSKDQVKMLAAQLAQQIPELAQAAQQQQYGDSQYQARILAAQQMFAPFLQSSLEGLRQSGFETNQTYQDAANTVSNPTVAALMRSRGSVLNQQANQMASAYAAQMALSTGQPDPATLAKQLQAKVTNSYLSQAAKQITGSGQATNPLAGVTG